MLYPVLLNYDDFARVKLTSFFFNLIGLKTSVVVKLLSEDPANYDDAPTEGIRRILQAELVDEKEKVFAFLFA